MKVREIKVKSIIVKSNLPDADYVINPYVGCQHGCVYCYARFMKRFTNHQEAWGQFVDVKANAPDLVPEQTLKYRNKSIFLSSVCDPYQALEKKYQLTRQILKKLIPLQPKLFIQTKSDLVLCDLDLLKQFQNCEVGLTITTLDDVLRKDIEPLTVSPERRIKALQELKTAGINTYVFIGPILPFLTDWQKIILCTKKFTDSYMFENLTVRATIWPSVQKWLQTKQPDLLPKYKKIYFNAKEQVLLNFSPLPQEGGRLRGGRDYWNTVESDIDKFCQQQKLNYRIYFHHKH